MAEGDVVSGRRKGKRCTPLQSYATGTVYIIFNKLGNIFL